MTGRPARGAAFSQVTRTSALWWADGVIAEFGGSRPWVYSDETWLRK